MENIIKKIFAVVMILSVLISGMPKFNIAKAEGDYVVAFSINNKYGMNKNFVDSIGENDFIVTIKDSNGNFVTNQNVNIQFSVRGFTYDFSTIFNSETNEYVLEFYSMEVTTSAGTTKPVYAEFLSKLRWIDFHIYLNDTYIETFNIPSIDCELNIYPVEGWVIAPSYNYENYNEYNTIFEIDGQYYDRHIFYNETNEMYGNIIINRNTGKLASREVYGKSVELFSAYTWCNIPSASLTELINDYEEMKIVWEIVDVAEFVRDTGVKAGGILARAYVAVGSGGTSEIAKEALVRTVKKAVEDELKEKAYKMALSFLYGNYLELLEEETGANLSGMTELMVQESTGNMEIEEWLDSFFSDEMDKALENMVIARDWLEEYDGICLSYDEAKIYNDAITNSIAELVLYSHLRQALLPSIVEQIADITVDFGQAYIGAGDTSIDVAQDLAAIIYKMLYDATEIYDKYCEMKMQFCWYEYTYLPYDIQYEIAQKSMDPILFDYNIQMNDLNNEEDDEFSATLNSISVNGINISSFSKNTYSYTTQAYPETSKYPIIKATAEEGMKIEYEYPSLTKVSWTSYVKIHVYPDTPEGKSEKVTYTVQVPRQSNSTAKLSWASTTGPDGEMISGFDPDIYEYNLEVAVTGTYPSLYGMKEDTHSSIIVQQPPQIPGDGRIIVTSEDGQNTTTYLFHYDFGGSGNNNLKSVKVDGEYLDGFKFNYTSYVYYLEQGEPIPTVTAQAADPNAYVEVRNSTSIDSATKIAIIAENGDVKWYFIYWAYLGDGDQVIYIPDPAFKEFLKSECNAIDREVLVSDTLEIRTLEKTYVTGETPITDLTGIGLFENLEQLEVRDHPVDTIRGVGNLDNLWKLQITNANLTNEDMLEISTLTSLEELWLNSNNISDVSMLANLTNLRILRIEDNNITDISPLATLPNLEQLYIMGNDNINNIESLKSIYFNLDQRDFSIDFSNNADLDVLMVNGKSVSGFSSSETNYYETIADSNYIPVVTGVPADPNATITFTRYDETVPGQVEIKVTAEDRVTTKTYTIYMLEDSSVNDTRLSGITVNGTTISNFSPDTYNYDISVNESETLSTNDIIGTPISSHANVFVKYDGQIPGTAEILVVQKGTDTTTYWLDIDYKYDCSSHTTGQGNIIGNILNSGVVVSDENYIYYIDESDSYYLYRATKDLSEKTRILEEPCSRLNLVDDMIYCTSGQDIIRIKTDGTGKETIIEIAGNNSAPMYTIIHNGYVYYRIYDNDTIIGNIYRKSITDISQPAELLIDIDALSINGITDQYVYAWCNVPGATTTTQRLYRYDINSGSLSMQIEEYAYKPVLDGDYFYCEGSYDSVFKYNLTNGSKTYLLGENANNSIYESISKLNVYNGRVYFSAWGESNNNGDDTIYSITTSGGNLTQHTPDGVMTSKYNLIDEYIYFRDDTPGANYLKLCRIPISGGAVEVVSKTLSSDNNLISMEINGVAVDGFSSDVLEYYYTGEYGENNYPTVTGETSSEAAKIVYQYTGDMQNDTAAININVYAENGDLKTYIIHYTVPLGTEAALETLLFETARISPEFDSEVYNYVLEVPWYTEEIPECIYKATDENAQVIVENAAAWGETTTITVTSEDGQTITTYSVLIDKEDKDMTVAVFADANFEQAVRDKIGKDIGDIYLYELIDIVTIEAISSDISSINGIEQMPNLERVMLADNNITDITPISGLLKLSELNLSSNNIANIAPVSGLTNLRLLNLSNNNIDSISALSSLVNLEELNVSYNFPTTVPDLSIINGLSNLSKLSVEACGVESISALSNLTNMEHLNVSNNNIENTESLGNLHGLQYLDVTCNVISDFSVLNGLTSLRYLYVQGNAYPSDYSVFSNIYDNLLYTDYNSSDYLTPDIDTGEAREVWVGDSIEMEAVVVPDIVEPQWTSDNDNVNIEGKNIVNGEKMGETTINTELFGTEAECDVIVYGMETQLNNAAFSYGNTFTLDQNEYRIVSAIDFELLLETNAETITADYLGSELELNTNMLFDPAGGASEVYIAVDKVLPNDADAVSDIHNYTFRIINCDLNNDNPVDILDVVTLAQVYGDSIDQYNLYGTEVVNLYDLIFLAIRLNEDPTETRLSDVKVNGTSYMDFDPDIFEFDVFVNRGSELTSDDIIGVPMNSNADVNIEYNGEIPGTAIITSTQSGAVESVYTLHIDYSEPRLSDIQIKNVSISGFDSDSYVYDLLIGSEEILNAEDIVGTPIDSRAIVTLGYESADAGLAIITVTHGLESSKYYINISRMDTRLSDIQIKGEIIEGFDSAILEYELLIPRGETLTAEDISYSAVNGDAVTYLNYDGTIPSNAEISVTHGNETSIYTLYISYSDPLLSDITIKGESLIGFDSNVFEYEYYLSNSEELYYYEIVGIPVNEDAIVEVDYDGMIPGVAEISVVHGEDTEQYSISINYVDPKLLDIMIGGVSLTGFDSDKYEYDYYIAEDETIAEEDISCIANNDFVEITVLFSGDVPGVAIIDIAHLDIFKSYTINFYQKIQHATWDLSGDYEISETSNPIYAPPYYRRQSVEFEVTNNKAGAYLQPNIVDWDKPYAGYWDITTQQYAGYDVTFEATVMYYTIGESYSVNHSAIGIVDPQTGNGYLVGYTSGNENNDGGNRGYAILRIPEYSYSMSFNGYQTYTDSTQEKYCLAKDDNQSLVDGTVHEEQWKIERIIENGNVRINFYVNGVLKLTALDDSELKYDEPMIGMAHFWLGNYDASFYISNAALTSDMEPKD